MIQEPLQRSRTPVAGLSVPSDREYASARLLDFGQESVIGRLTKGHCPDAQSISSRDKLRTARLTISSRRDGSSY